MSAGGESEHADLVRIDVPLGGVQAHESHRPLRILQRRLRLRVDATVAVPLPRRPRARHAVLQQHARDAVRRQPVADLGALEIDREDLIAAAGKDDDRGAGVLPRRRIHRERRTRDVLDVGPRLARHEMRRSR